MPYNMNSNVGLVPTFEFVRFCFAFEGVVATRNYAATGAPNTQGEEREASICSFERWDIEEATRRVFRGIEKMSDEDAHALARLEIAYYQCELEDALERANALVASPDACVAMGARTTRLAIHVACGNAAQAYVDLEVLKETCAKGLVCRDDNYLFAASVLSALRVENIVMTSLFDLPDLSVGMDSITNGLKMYFGYLIALRMLRMGQPEGAIGIAYTFQTLVGPLFPGSRTFLHLVAAAADMILGRTDAARREFDEAWKLKDEFGVLVPFVEMNYLMFGLARKYQDEPGYEEESRRVASLVRSFRDGWFGLRHRCGLPCESEQLTVLESHVSGLAALGWRNREIANHLSISENTVKHQLSSAYQKLHISNRGDMRKLYLRYENHAELWV